MALPVAHLSIALGAAGPQSWRCALFLCLLAIAPDFDFALVWGLGLPIDAYHRTFSHSLAAAVLTAAAFARYRPSGLPLSTGLILAVGLSHGLLDMLCTSDAADHGVMLLWPFSEARYGWPVLVPLYRRFAESPFSWAGAFRFTLLELLLAPLLWGAARLLRRGGSYLRPIPAAVSGSSSAQSKPGSGRSRGAISSRLSPS